MLVGIVGWVVFGLFVGFIASKFVDLRGDDPRLGICMGALGGFVGGWLYSLFSGSAVTYFNTRSLLFAGIAAVVAAAAWHGWRRSAAQ
jgi:uncharacterized membrane protein YeaQ/YmgE (transglycosylase-associated protein family)